MKTGSIVDGARSRDTIPEDHGWFLAGPASNPTTIPYTQGQEASAQVGDDTAASSAAAVRLVVRLPALRRRTMMMRSLSTTSALPSYCRHQRLVAPSSHRRPPQTNKSAAAAAAARAPFRRRAALVVPCFAAARRRAASSPSAAGGGDARSEAARAVEEYSSGIVSAEFLQSPAGQATAECGGILLAAALASAVLNRNISRMETGRRTAQGEAARTSTKLAGVAEAALDATLGAETAAAMSTALSGSPAARAAEAVAHAPLFTKPLHFLVWTSAAFATLAVCLRTWAPASAVTRDLLAGSAGLASPLLRMWRLIALVCCTWATVLYSNLLLDRAADRQPRRAAAYAAVQGLVARAVAATAAFFALISLRAPLGTLLAFGGVGAAILAVVAQHLGRDVFAGVAQSFLNKEGLLWFCPAGRLIYSHLAAHHTDPGSNSNRGIHNHPSSAVRAAARALLRRLRRRLVRRRGYPQPKGVCRRR